MGKVGGKGRQMGEGDLTRGTRLQIMLTDDEIEALDNWRFGARMPSRAAAVRELLRRGLDAEGVMMKNGRTRSQDFGVIAPDGKGRDGDGKSRDKGRKA
jgi:hypothetical protein